MGGHLLLSRSLGGGLVRFCFVLSTYIQYFVHTLFIWDSTVGEPYSWIQYMFVSDRVGLKSELAIDFLFLVFLFLFCVLVLAVWSLFRVPTTPNRS